MNKTDHHANEQHWRLLVLFLKEVATDRGITQEQLAEATGFTQSNIARIFSLKYTPKLSTYLAIAQALQLNLFFETRDSGTEPNVLFERAMDQLGRRPDSLPKN